MIRFFFLLILVNTFHSSIFAADNPSSVLENVLNPISIHVVGDRIIILDLGDNLVKVFNRQTLEKTAVIGKVGEGPGEYQPEELTVLPTKDNICISAVKKVIYFSYDGCLLSEKSFPANFSSILPIKDHYLGFTISLGGKSFSLDYHLIDNTFKSIKKLYSGHWAVNKKTGKWDMFEVFFHGIAKNKLIIAHRTEPKVMIYDMKGELESEIKLKKSSKPFTEKDQKKIAEFMMSTTGNRARFSRLKERWIYPECFPTIMTCRIDEPFIYVLTYNDILGKGIETKKYNIQTKIVETVFLPLKYSALNNTMISPFCIHHNIFYQLEENDAGDWQLRKTKID